jgi:hypothetical protein
MRRLPRVRCPPWAAVVRQACSPRSPRDARCTRRSDRRPRSTGARPRPFVSGSGLPQILHTVSGFTCPSGVLRDPTGRRSAKRLTKKGRIRRVELRSQLGAGNGRVATGKRRSEKSDRKAGAVSDEMGRPLATSSPPRLSRWPRVWRRLSHRLHSPTPNRRSPQPEWIRHS